MSTPLCFVGARSLLVFMASTHNIPNTAARFANRPGRPHAISARFSDDELRVMDHYARQLNLSRAQLMRTAVGTFLAVQQGNR